MPKTIHEAVIADYLIITGIKYVFERDKDPKTGTIKKVVSYELLDNNDEVVQLINVGVDLDPQEVIDIRHEINRQWAAMMVREGIS